MKQPEIRRTSGSKAVAIDKREDLKRLRLLELLAGFVSTAIALAAYQILAH